MKLASCLLFGLFALAFVSPILGQSKVPAWNTRGVGLPQQGIACLDVADDGAFVVGTFASPADPNVFVFDADGKFLRSHVIGQRAINQLAVSRQQLHAICTMPDGKAGDGPMVFLCGDAPVAIPSGLGESGYPRTIFHYGDHSNHTGVQISATDLGNVALYGNHVLWLDESGKQARSDVQVPWARESVATVLAAHRSGAAVAGYSVLKSTTTPEANLFLVRPGEKQPKWKRPAVNGVGECERPEKGLYGTPTLRDGTREDLPQHDLAVVAPLSIAVDRGAELSRIATADYPGFQRWIRSSATGKEQDYGTRCMPASPTVNVYDAEGTLVRRFGPEKFNKPCWVDLAFLPGEKQLLAYPHHWTSRGLAGQPHLPADDDAKTVWLLDVESGEVQPLEFPDAVADADVNDRGQMAVICWDGRLYLLTAEDFKTGQLLAGIDVHGPALVRSRLKEGWIVAASSGLVQILDAAGKSVTETNLSDGTHSLVDTQPWIKNAKAEKITDGLWGLPGGRVESDLGGQRVIETPQGLILIEGHAGLSFDREWHAMQAAGLDPTQVKFVLTTHEHGDHSPGAYLWRVKTGAQFVCSREMAYTLQHHIPQCSGYGMHPPVPTDIRIKNDEDLDLCGSTVRAVRIPGHTFGSMGWLVERGGKKYVAIGDLIMPDGVLGYSGSVNFSGTDVLASLRKLESLNVDFILPGHGPITSPERYLAAGIGVGSHVGWGKMRPEKPDSRYRLKQENVVVAAWNLDETSADFGDINGDGLPDTAVVVPSGEEAVVQVFLNQGKAKFAEKPELVLKVAVPEPNKLRVRELNGDGRLDLFVGGRSSALLLSTDEFPKFETTLVGVGDGNQARRIELAAGQQEIVVNARFGTFQRLTKKTGETEQIDPKITGPYLDVWSGDINGDGRSDLVYPYGQIFLRAADGKLPAEPSLRLPVAKGNEWCYFSVGDYNGDQRPDILFFTFPQEAPQAAVFYNTGKSDAPFAMIPDATLDLCDPPGERKNQKPLLRDTIVATDWNNDGIQDLVLGKGQGNYILIIPGSRTGLDFSRRERISLDYSIHYETNIFVGDFNGDKKPDIACLGYTNTGVGAGGPLAAYIYLQP